jgi:hypothetical protein
MTNKLGRQVLIAQKHSPVMLFGVGVVGVVTTAILASRATLKLDEILGEAEEKKTQIEQAQAENDERYDEEAAKKDGIVVRTQTALKIAKLYAPAVVSATLTVSAFTGSHIILTRRNAAITAAYAALDRGFKQYRERVIGELGGEKDEEFRFGVIEKEMAVDTDEGVAVKTVRTLDKDQVKARGGSIYSRFFDEYSQNWSKVPSYNQMFLQAQQQYANDLLNARGHVFLNEVYDMLGLERSKEGAVVGWVKGHGDGYVDFGVFRNDTYMGMQFVNGVEKSILLDFNVDGVIYDLI